MKFAARLTLALAFVLVLAASVRAQGGCTAPVGTRDTVLAGNPINGVWAASTTASVEGYYVEVLRGTTVIVPKTDVGKPNPTTCPAGSPVPTAYRYTVTATIPAANDYSFRVTAWNFTAPGATTRQESPVASRPFDVVAPNPIPSAVSNVSVQ